MEWQPIETAPKDGTLISVWIPVAQDWNRTYYSDGTRRPNPEEDLVDCCFFPKVYWDAETGWTDGNCLDFLDMDNIQPTHWMPLPEPPKP